MSASVWAVRELAVEVVEALRPAPAPALRTASRAAADSGWSDSACQLPQNSPSRWVMPVSPGSSMTVSRLPSASALALELADVRGGPRKLRSTNWSRRRGVLGGDHAGADLARATGMLRAGWVNGVAAAIVHPLARVAGGRGVGQVVRDRVEGPLLGDARREGDVQAEEGGSHDAQAAVLRMRGADGRRRGRRAGRGVARWARCAGRAWPRLRTDRSTRSSSCAPAGR